jgi:hypothetical protein
MPTHSVTLDFLREKATKATLQILALEVGLCFECGGKLQEKDGELACTGCGVVWGNGALEDNHIPFGKDSQSKDFEGHFSPPNQLAFNKGMGTNQFLSRASFCRIVSAAGKEDLGLRAQHLRHLTNRVEHPWILQLLEQGSRICKDFDLHKEKNNACIRFANEYGRVLRKLGAFLVVRGKHWNELKKTARAAFIVLYREFAGEEKAEEAKQQLGVDDKFLGYVHFLVDALTTKLRKAKKKRAQF